ncbi:hypothetical protein BH20ACT16_BH20ACT16_03170 [soil metagenome]
MRWSRERMSFALKRGGEAWIAHDELITGKRLQALAGLSLVSRASYEQAMASYDFHLRLRAHVPRLVIYDDPTQLDLRDLSQRSSLFVYTHVLDDFKQHVWPHLDGTGHVLMTHNSDLEVGDADRPLLDDPRLAAWFAQNALIDHPKLVPLPIGIANAMWKHGNLDVLHRAIVRGQHSERSELVFLHFNPATYAGRQPIWDALRKNFPHIPATPAASKGYKHYLADLARHRFCVAPRGNGVDTHRVWECLYLGVTPIVERSTHTEHWERLGLDILVIDDWAQVTPAFLEEAQRKRPAPAAGNREPLTLSHYARLVDGAIASTEPAR